jgi:dihydroorotase
MTYDFILKNGHVVDPSRDIDGVMDVAITDGRIAAVGSGLTTQGSATRDVSGQYVCPGLIDLHGHWYEASAFGIDPDMCLNHGVTTVVDAGTAGFINFPHFRTHTIERARVDILAFIHIGCLGIPTSILGELEDLRYARPVETAAMIEKHRDIALGVKLREGTMTSNHGVRAFELAMQASQEAKTRLMLHISAGSPTREILPALRPGDIITHCFEGRGDGIFDCESGLLLNEVVEARRRGIIFDVGHGCGSFHWDTARRAFEYSFFPDTISTDLHRYSVERFAIDMPTTMSKFLEMGMPLRDVVLKCTWAPAQAVGHPELGTLRPGSAADVLVFDIEEGEFSFEDTHFQVVKGSRRIRPRLVLKKGELIEPGSVPVRLREFCLCDQDVWARIERTK